MKMFLPPTHRFALEVVVFVLVFAVVAFTVLVLSWLLMWVMMLVMYLPPVPAVVSLPDCSLVRFGVVIFRWTSCRRALMTLRGSGRMVISINFNLPDICSLSIFRCFYGYSWNGISTKRLTGVIKGNLFTYPNQWSNFAPEIWSHKLHLEVE